MTFTPEVQYLNEQDYAGVILPAIVVNDNDPLLIGRIKARVSLFHQGYADDQLPWCMPFIVAPNGTAPGMGSLNVPATGSLVALFVPLKDPVNCYYLGNLLSSNNTLADFITNYPYVYGNVDRAGNLFKVDTKAGTWTYNMVDGSFIEFNNGTLNIVATSELMINVQGDANINASGAVNISGTSVNLNPSSNPASSVSPRQRTAPTATTFSNQTDY